MDKSSEWNLSQMQFTTGTNKIPNHAPQQCIAGEEILEDLICHKCQKGFHITQAAVALTKGMGTVCVSCKSGTIADREGMADCLECPKGKWSNGHRTACEDCPVGTARDVIEDGCQACGVGHISKHSIHLFNFFVNVHDNVIFYDLQ